MPGYDKTGPLGKGKRTGRGLGICFDKELEDDVKIDFNVVGLGRGRGRRLGRGRGLRLGRGRLNW